MVYLRTMAFLLMACIASLSANKKFEPVSYAVTLTENEQYPEYVHRSLCLSINGEIVGTVTYEINYNASIPSFVHELHVAQEHRNHRGYGKVLLYQALKDILQAGSTLIELERQPFDLSSTENAKNRDAQLKKWYRKFGFKETGLGTSIMKLNPAKLLATEVVSTYTENGIIFTFRKPLAISQKKLASSKT